jgi:hypothetical protein
MPSTCLQAISISGTRVLCHGLFAQVHSRSNAYFMVHASVVEGLLKYQP